MSDLNQLINAYKEGKKLEELREPMLTIIRKYVNNQIGPQCCFWIGKLEDLNDDNFKEGYIDYDFKNYARKSDDLIIGCSRGCLSIEDLGKIYFEKLCKGCIDEAKKILEI